MGKNHIAHVLPAQLLGDSSSTRYPFRIIVAKICPSFRKILRQLVEIPTEADFVTDVPRKRRMAFLPNGPKDH